MSVPRRPSTTADPSTGAAVVSLHAEPADEPVAMSDVEVAAARARAVERDLDGWVNWLARPEKKVAIIGFTATRDEAPWADPTFEKWACNNLHLHLKPEQQWDRLYDLHDYKTISADKPHEAFLRTCDKPVYVWEPRPEWPASTPFPKQHVLDSFGNYFTNSISWMVAAAIIEGVTELHVYGVDLAQGTEYCVSGDTRVLTADLRWVPAEQIEVGNRVIAFDEETNPHPSRYRRWREAMVEEVHELVEPSYRLHMEDGTKLISSAKHRWLTHRNDHTKRWRATEDLQPVQVYPQRASRLVKVLDVWEEDRSWGAGYLAAAFDGEGHLSQRQLSHTTTAGLKLGFAQRPNVMAETVEMELRDRKFEFGKHCGKEGTYKYDIRGGRADIMRFLGTVRPRRLLSNFQAEALGQMRSKEQPRVVEAEFIGDHPVIGLKTTTGTFIAEGFASHNSQQRPSCEHMLGVAQGRGVKIHIPPTSDLLKAAVLYGVEDDSFIYAKLAARETELTQRLGVVQQQQQQLRDQQMQMLGALENNRYYAGVWVNARANRDGTPKVESEEVKPAEAPTVGA